MTVHLHPTAPLAERVLLPGDPGRALMLAQALLDRPLMFNHNRGLWGYSGTAADGAPLTIQATGIGGPSAAIVVAELIDLGARRLVRVGTCGALDPALALGDLVAVDAAVAGDGTSRALGADGTVAPDAALLAALVATSPAATVGRVVTADLFYGPTPSAPGALAVEMEAAAILQLARVRGVAAGCVLAVSDVLSADGRSRLDADGLARAGEAVGRAGAAALGAV